MPSWPRRRPGPRSIGNGSRRAFLVGLAATLSPIIWWLGWYPGFFDPDTMHQWEQVSTGELTNITPASHTVLLLLLRSPGLVTFLQVLAVGVLFAAIAARVTRLGVPWQAAAGIVVAASWLPPIGVMALSPGPATAQGLAALWVFAELLDVAHRGRDALAHLPSALRLGLALGAVWVLGHAGFAVSLAVAAVLVVLVRDDPSLIAPIAAAAGFVVLLVQAVLFPLLGVDRQVRPLGEAYAPEVAAVYHHHPDVLGTADLTLMADVADLEVWDAAYRCQDGRALIEHPEFDESVIRDDPGPYRGLSRRVLRLAAGTVFGHRFCAAAFLFLPGRPTGRALELPPSEIPENDLGMVSDPIWEPAQRLTGRIFEASRARAWLFWSPAWPLWLAAGAFAAAALRRRLRLLLPALVLGASLVISVATVRAPAFADAFSVYLPAVASLPLLWPASGGLPPRSYLGRGPVGSSGLAGRIPPG